MLRRLCLAAVSCFIVQLFCISFICATEPAAEEKREHLAVHDTVATLQKVEFRLCRGLTSLCPKECGHSGNFATFTIKKYLKYDKVGEFGDPQQTAFLVQISDYDKRPQGDPAILKAVQDLKPGDFVRLTWHHDYVTKAGSSSPERPIIKLEKLTAAEAAALLDKAD